IYNNLKIARLAYTGSRAAGHARGAVVPLAAGPGRRAVLRQVVQGWQGVLPTRAKRRRAEEEVPAARSSCRGEGHMLLDLHIPGHVPLGTRAALSCRWQLGPADVLYSVKWYKDGKEFFRHVPRDVKLRRKFPLPG
ncbi:Beat-IIIc, partial [Operophtera brumata]